MNDFQQQYRFIKWTANSLKEIAAVIGGISVILSISGFLILRSHSNLLGLSTVLHHSVGNYLYEGGVFFISTILWAFPSAIIGNLYGSIFIGCLILYSLIKRIILKYFSKTINISLKGKVVTQEIIRLIFIVFGSVILLCFIYNFFPNKEAKDLLFPSGNKIEVAKRANKDSAKELEDRYVLSVLCVILSGFTIWGVKKIFQYTMDIPSSALLNTHNEMLAKETKLKKNKIFLKKDKKYFSELGILLLYLLFIIQLFLLPLTYGQSVYYRIGQGPLGPFPS